MPPKPKPKARAKSAGRHSEAKTEEQEQGRTRSVPVDSRSCQERDATSDEKNSYESATSAMVKHMFRKYDSNQDGKISRDELKQVMLSVATLSESGDAMDSVAVDALFDVVDQKRDGFIEYDEFVNFIFSENNQEVRARAQIVESALSDRALVPLSTDGLSAFGYSSGLLKGWIRQPSNCCAGASVAACLNALRGDTIEESEQFTINNICGVLADIIEAQATVIRERLEAQLEGSMDICLHRLEDTALTKKCSKVQLRKIVQDLAVEGGEGVLSTLQQLVGIGDDSESHMNGEHGEQLARQVVVKVTEEVESTDPREKASCPKCGDKNWDCGERQLSTHGLCDACKHIRAERCLTCNYDVCRSCLFPGKVNDEGAFVSQGRVATHFFYCGRRCEALPGSDGRCGPNDGPQCASCQRFQQRPVIQSLLAGAGEKIADWGSLVSWDAIEADMVEWLAKLGGARKLRHPERPSTWCVGNSTLIEAVTQCQDFCAQRYMGIAEEGSMVEIPISKTDTDDDIVWQWEQLKLAFEPSSQHVLLFHLTNHYCPIYAWRERVDAESSSTVTREVLSNTAGQKPTTWIDWNKCRKIMLGWTGYKILKINRA